MPDRIAMQTTTQISPVLCAACGTACAYYGLFPLYRSEFISIAGLFVLLFVTAGALCFFRVLASWPLKGELSPQADRLLRLIPLRVTAFSAGLALGMSMGASAVQAVSFGIPENTVRAISGIALDDPRIISGGRAATTLALQMLTGQSGVRATAHGTVTVFFAEENTARLREFGRGTAIFAEGMFRRGAGNIDGAYMFTADSLHVTEPAPPLERFRTNLRLGLTQRFDSVWGGLALALLLGIRDNLDTGIASLYRDAGCSHILALSGMHLAVLVALISFVLKRALGLRPAAILGAVIIVVYCYIVGPLPSLNRAALMYLLGVLTVLGMFKRDPFSLLCLAFLLQLIMTPQAGISLSFILSYLALAGILTVGSLFDRIFKGKIPPILLSPFSASVGAFIATAGVTAWFFGILRPVGIIASLILTPLTTVFMIGSMAWLPLNLALPAFSPLLGYPLSMLYWLMEKTALTASYVPGIRAKPYMVLLFSVLSVVMILLLEFRRRSAGNRLEPFA